MNPLNAQVAKCDFITEYLCFISHKLYGTKYVDKGQLDKKLVDADLYVYNNQCNFSSTEYQTIADDQLYPSS